MIWFGVPHLGYPREKLLFKLRVNLQILFTDRRCQNPPLLQNIAGVNVFRRTLNGSREQVLDGSYQYGDEAEYECIPGYRKSWPIISHYCHAEQGWTGTTNCICKQNAIRMGLILFIYYFYIF